MKNVKDINASLQDVLNQVVGNIVVNNTLNTTTTLDNVNAPDITKSFRYGKVYNVNADTNTISLTLLNTNETLSISYNFYSLSNYPSVDTLVEIGYDENNEEFINRVIDVKNVENVVETSISNMVYSEDEGFSSSIIIYPQSITINGDDFGGLIKIQELTDKLNKLTDDFNSFIQKYNAHIHTTTATIGPGPAVGVIAPTTSQGTTTSSFNKDDYENTNVSHGTPKEI